MQYQTLQIRRDALYKHFCEKMVQSIHILIALKIHVSTKIYILIIYDIYFSHNSYDNLICYCFIFYYYSFLFW